MSRGLNLEKLLAAWANSPSEELDELITMASSIERSHPTGLRGNTKQAREAWAALAKQPAAADVPALLEALTDVLWRDALARLTVMRTWPPDPRVDDKLVQLLQAMPYRSLSKPFYTEVIALASRIRDPSLFARIEVARSWIKHEMSPTLGDWLERRVDELIDELRPRLWKPAKPDKKLAAIREQLEAKAKQHAPRAELGDLLQSIYERPDDIARRLVYADALLERGDVRGELITLQCQETLTNEQQRRVRALLKDHGIEWLGPLAPIIRKGFQFERGFLADCTIDSNKGTRIRPLVGHPAWSTVHTLADSALIALHPVMRSLRALTFRPNRARSREELDDSWRELLAGTPRPIEKLHYTDIDTYADREEQLQLLSRCDALPNLRELFVGGLGVLSAEQLAVSPVAARLSTIGFVHDMYEVEPPTLRRVLRDARVPAIVIQQDEVRVRIERGASGYERARFLQQGREIRQSTIVLGALPPTLRELYIVTTPDTDRGALVALANAARAFPALEVRRIGAS